MLRAMARGLVQAGITVDVATTDDNQDGRLDVSNSEPIIEAGVTYYYFARQSHFYSFSWPLTRWLEQHTKNYDLVHAHGLFSYATIPAAYWASHYKVPYIVRPFGVLNRWGMANRRRWLKKISFNLIESRILVGAAAIHYTSEQERLEAAELGVRGRPVIIPNSVEIPPGIYKTACGQFRARHPGLAERTVILFLSRLDQKKGLDLLLPAFARVLMREPSATLVIAGDGEPAFVEAIKQEAVRLGITRSLLWTGFLTGEDKWAALLDADVFVLPSYSENFGVAVIEAMACGLPVVVSDQVAIHGEISEAKAGLVVACEAQALTEALVTLLERGPLRSEMGKRGITLVRTKYSPEIMKRELLALYRDLVRSTSPSSEQVVA